MKKNKYLIVGVCIILLVAYIHISKEENPLVNVEKFRVYYRDIDETILEDMQNLDLVIVEASHFNQQNVQSVKKNGTIILGYLSIMEIGKWDSEVINQLDPSDYLTIDGERVYNEKYENYLGDLSKEHYREVLLDTLEKRILSKGMDGVFFDTIGWLDSYKNDGEVYDRLKVGYEELLKRIRKRFSGIYILQNRGFKSFYEVSCKYTQGIMWENFDITTADQRESVRDRINKLERLRRKNNIQVFTISFENADANKNFTQKMKWKYLQESKEYRYIKW